MFENPSAVYSSFRRLILGIDTNGGGAGVLRGFPTFNLDMAVTRGGRFAERAKLLEVEVTDEHADGGAAHEAH